jgi:hypothetical protein
MFPPGADSGRRARKTVVCIACGSSVLRSKAREYDKKGDRWDRHDKEFEHLCKECYRNLCHQPRDELEGLLVDIAHDEELSRDTFLTRYYDAVEKRYDSAEESES